MTFLLSAAAPPGKAFAVSDLLEQGERLADKQFADNAALQAEMVAGVAEHYMAAERWDKAVPLLERAAAIAGRQSDPAVRARALCPLAMMQMAQGQPKTAEATMRSALADLPDEPQHALQRAQCLIHASSFGFFTNQAEPTIRDAAAAIELLERTSIPTTLKDIDGPALLAYGYYLARRNREADEVYERLMVSLQRLGRERTATAASVLNNWGLVHYQGQIIKSEPLYRRAIELRSSIEGAAAIAPTVTYNHAGALLRLARFEEARRFFEATISNADARQEHRVKFDAMMQLADLHIESGDLDAAIAQLETVKPFLAHPAFDSRRVALLAYYKGRIALAQHDPARARSEFSAAVAQFEKGGGGKFAVNVLALIGLARAEQALEQAGASPSTLQRALALAESFVEPGAPSYLVGLCRLAQGDSQLANGDRAAARSSFDAALLHLSQSLGNEHPAVEQARRSRDALPDSASGAATSSANTR
jgi:tetratricopeptide (TPR) repeat protein